MRQREKFTIESGVSLPIPSSLKEGWEEDSLYFPDVMEDEVQAYMQPSAKAMKQEKSFLKLRTHTQCKISPHQYICEVLFYSLSLCA